VSEVIENQVATNLYETRISSGNLLVSSIVGVVQSVCDFEEGMEVNRGDFLVAINFLGIIYNISMEDNGILKKLYIESGQILGFETPIAFIIFSSRNKQLLVV
jgi:biotin carboxyl carrier protein